MKRFFATDTILAELKNYDFRSQKMLDSIAYLISLNYLNIVDGKNIISDTICSTPGRGNPRQVVVHEDGKLINKTIKDRIIYFSANFERENGTEELYIFATIVISDHQTTININYGDRRAELRITDYVCDNLYSYFDEDGKQVVEEKVVLYDRNYNPAYYCMNKEVDGEHIYEGKLNNINTKLDDSITFIFESQDNLKPKSMLNALFKGNFVQATQYEESGVNTTESIFVRLKAEIEERLKAKKKSEYKRQRKELKNKKTQEV